MSKNKNKEEKPGKLKLILLSIFLLIIVGGCILGYSGWKRIYSPNVKVSTEKPVYLYVRTGSDFNDVVSSFKLHHYLENIKSFIWVAGRKHYTSKVLPGRYRLKDGMSNNELLNMLRAGKQEPVKLIFFGIRKKEELVHRVASRLETDSLALLNALNNNSLLKKYHLNKDNILTLFIPNTYQLNWNNTPEQFLDRMAKEHDAFWTDEKKKKAEEIGLSKVEVSVLASIVQSESNKDDDKPVIAGVYINRLHRDMPLEADPTLVWALNDFTIKRVLNEHKKIESPYNTYKYTGLPPGPITLPTIPSLDAVLNYEKHNYIYFCAKEDFSGYSNFACTLKDHMANARRYQHELSKRKIYR
jgi:UPF0755 protein